MRPPDSEIAEALTDAAQLVFEQLPHAGSLLHHDQVVCAELVERDRLAGEWVAGRANEHDRIAEERFEGDAAMATRCADNPELELARGDALDDRLCVEHPERDVQLRMELLELAEELCDHDPAGAGRGADLEGPGKLIAALEPDLGDDLLLEGEQPLRAPVEAQPRLGRLDATAGPVEQLWAG